MSHTCEKFVKTLILIKLREIRRKKLILSSTVLIIKFIINIETNPKKIERDNYLFYFIYNFSFDTMEDKV
jgi:hypothetical protein